MTANSQYGCHAAIVTAVEIETAGIRQVFGGWRNVPVPMDSDRYRATEVTLQGTEQKLILAQQKVMGMTAASMLATKVIYTFRPRYLIMCGIAAGIGEEAVQMYGDVIVPDMIWDYSTGKFVGPEESEIRFGDVGFLPRPASVHTDDDLLEIVKGTIGSPENEFHVHIGPMACGSSVVANQEVVDKQVKALLPTTVGLDMESYSVLFAARHASAPKPKALVVKSICDFANSEKSDQYQRFAAYTSSGYVKYLLEECLPVE